MAWARPVLWCDAMPCSARSPFSCLVGGRTGQVFFVGGDLFPPHATRRYLRYHHRKHRPALPAYAYLSISPSPFHTPSPSHSHCHCHTTFTPYTPSTPVPRQHSCPFKTRPLPHPPTHSKHLLLPFQPTASLWLPFLVYHYTELPDRQAQADANGCFSPGPELFICVLCLWLSVASTIVTNHDGRKPASPTWSIDLVATRFSAPRLHHDRFGNRR